MFSGIPIKKKADLEAIIGKSLTKELCARVGKPDTQKKPKRVYLKSEKPKFYLDRGDVLYAFGVNLKTEEITGYKYCGSEDSTYMHYSEQLGENGSPEDGFAVFFVTNYWNGKNRSWDLTIVSPNITQQIELKNAV